MRKKTCWYRLKRLSPRLAFILNLVSIGFACNAVRLAFAALIEILVQSWVETFYDFFLSGVFTGGQGWAHADPHGYGAS